MTSDTVPPAVDDDVPWLSTEQQLAWRALFAMIDTLPAAIDAQLKRDAGVNRYEYQVLAVLSQSPGHTVGLSLLAEEARGSLSRLSHALTRLEKAGWVERCPATEPGGRRMRARLTESGLAKIEAIAPGHVREVRRLVVDVLTDEQLVALGEIATAVTAAAQREVAEACTEVPDC
ncbi:MarR family winged helix-turn-helix transcriptional regulator [Aeromicrobium flavum]|uniref:MarR family winged helix-turn-helix transcriptional regulator n=1 Tax=Aeromicrobium flavum TaxID=416568 RepID=UPI001C9A2A03|nr:MarR family transcriptional regulator [Aeromicrobium flavum]